MRRVTVEDGDYRYVAMEEGVPDAWVCLEYQNDRLINTIYAAGYKVIVTRISRLIASREAA